MIVNCIYCRARKLKQQNAELEAELRVQTLLNYRNERDALVEAVRDAYFDGWHDGRNTTTVDGDTTYDWNDSETKALLEKAS